AEPTVVDWCPGHGVPFVLCLHLTSLFCLLLFASRVVFLGSSFPLDTVSQ
ncbi:hypothetical protein JOB18_026007, partial [Solea senegalensis]